MQRNISEQRQGAIQLCCWRVERESRRLPAGLREQADAEEGALISDVEALPRRRALAQHLRGEIGDTTLSTGISSSATSDDQCEISQRQFVLLDNHQFQAVGQFPGDDWRQ